MTPGQRFINMILDALQVFFSTVWGLIISALSGAIPALAGVAGNYGKYGESYWKDMIPVFLGGALVGAATFLQSQTQIKKALMETPPDAPKRMNPDGI